MAGELQVSSVTGITLYFLIRDRNGNIWNTVTNGFEVFAGANYANYTIAGTEQGTAGYYTGTMPSQIPAGTYAGLAKRQAGASPAQGDATVGGNNVEWNGSALAPLSDTATSGQVGQIGPIRVARGVMIQNFPLFLKSAADHVTPLTSGVVSGQIARDGGSFGALQSGNFVEIGLGWYNVNLTSGDLLANTVKLHFTAVGISGGASDPLPIGIITQRVSGQ